MGRTMIPVDEAMAKVLSAVRPLPRERVPLTECEGRVLAEAVSTDMDFPPFDKACMDGFACRQQDLSQTLEIVETVPAGKVPTLPVGAGQATRIMTGAPVPEGADVVFMVEQSEVVDGKVRFTGAETMPNIAWCGEDLKRGDAVLDAGIQLGPKHVAVLASVGVAEPLVSVRPKVGVIATGDELVDPSEQPEQGQIRNSNSAQLVAQARRAGADPIYYGIARDDAAEIEASLRKCLAECDVVLLSGGVSMGDFDLVPEVMRKCGVTIHFDQVAVKPGKPVTFGTSPEAVVFGMPGNPVSTYVIFEIFVRSYLRACMGDIAPPARPAVALAAPLVRRRSERLEYVPVRIDGEGRAVPVRYHGSAHFFGLSLADGLVRLPVGTTRIEAGTMVQVLPT